MSELKCTPPPWTVEAVTRTGTYTIHEAHLRLTAINYAGRYMEEGRVEDAANCCMIGAAPAMYEALKQATSFLTAEGSEWAMLGGSKDDLKAVLRECETAIAQAERG